MLIQNGLADSLEATSKNPKAVRLIFKTVAENPELARSSLRIATRVSRSLAKRKAKKNMAAARSVFKTRNK